MGSTNEEQSAFTDLLRPHLERLYRLSYRLTGARADAEDLLQEVLAKLYERRDELTSISDLGPWLGRVLYNRFVDDTRKHARKRLTLIDPASLDTHGRDCDCDGPHPELAAQQEFSIRQVRSALASLSIEHRTVLLMHDTEGYTLLEIQAVTGVELGTLKSRLHRARARLRGLLEADGTFSAPGDV